MPYPYYGGFPMSYTPAQVPQIAQPQPTPQPQVINSRIWVSGLAGAKAYLVAPSTDVELWDSEAKTIYLKAADASGLPSMKILDYVIRDEEKPVEAVEQPSPINPSEYVLKADFDALKGDLEALKEQMKHVPRQANKPKGGAKL